MQKVLTAFLFCALAVAISAQSPLTPPPDVTSPPDDASETESGVHSKVLTPGTGTERPQPTDVVTLHYTGWVSSDGRMFDSSVSRGTPATFPLDRVVEGLRECVLLMRTGETRRCWVPEELAYRDQPGRPEGMVVFDVELIDTRRSPLIPPPDVKAPPEDAMRTESGLAYQVLRPGTGMRKPTASSRVTVHYSGWTTDGKLFDSSVARGMPATFGLFDVIPGWTEGVQLMVEGERTRFWIPESLAYKGEIGQPSGMLVFDIELIRIE